MSDENGKIEVTADTPVGKLAAKGIRVSDIISLAGVASAVLMIYMLFEHKAESKELSVTVASAINKLADTQRETVRAQREMTCIISLPPEKREREFATPGGLCKRVSAF